MSGKPRVDRSPEEKWQIIQEGLKVLCANWLLPARQQRDDDLFRVGLLAVRDPF